MNARAKGLSYCREVKKILLENGYHVEGPGFAVLFFNGRSVPVHRDFFNLFDLMSYKDGQFWGHQVSDIHHKSEKIKAISEAGFQGWVWSRTKEGRKVKYRVFNGDMEITI